MIRAAYVHVPFCPHLCAYCAFDKSLNLSHIPQWLSVITQEIRQEIKKQKQSHPDFALSSLYFGGGTPSCLSLTDLQALAECFEGTIDENTEWTLEVNPEQASLENLKAWKALGINRLSMGIQSFCDVSLVKMNRHHTAAQAMQAFEDARKAGFENLSCDLIFALPWQSLEDVRQDLEAFLKLEADHVSIYSLQIEENSVFGKQKLKPLDEDLEADMYELICRTLKKAGYDHYEISSFSRQGRYSRHNLAYWSDQPYFGFGFGACGRDETGRYCGPSSLRSYLQNGYCKQYVQDGDPAFEAIMTGLRTRFGLDISQWNRTYGRDLEAEYGLVLKKWASFLETENGRLRVSEKGMEILNSLLVDFMD